MRKHESSLVFGMTDGAVLVLGLLLGEVLSRQPGAALWHAALGGGLAELGGMSLGQYWAYPPGQRDKKAAALNGAGCAAATIIAGAPFAVFPVPLAAAVSSAVIFLLAVAICVLREETGLAAVARTFGLLAVAGVLSGASAFA
jgi:hypothetical protein